MTMGVFSHLTPTCTPCEKAAREAAKTLGVGAVDTSTLVKSAGGIPTLNPTASQAVQLLLAGRYAQMTGSGVIANGVAVNEPGLDPAADYQTLVAAQQGSGMTVLDQLKTLPAGAVALFDFGAVVSNLNGTPEDIPYAIAKNAQVAKTLAPQGQLVALSGGAAGAEETKKGNTPLWGGLAVGGVVFLSSGNPLAAGVAGLATGLVLSKVG